MRACCLFCSTGIDAYSTDYKLMTTHGACTWLFLAYDQTRRHALINIRTVRQEQMVRYLPDMLVPCLGHGQHALVFLAATLPARGPKLHQHQHHHVVAAHC